jgi:hypothetical protein
VGAGVTRATWPCSRVLYRVAIQWLLEHDIRGLKYDADEPDARDRLQEIRALGATTPKGREP